MGYIGKKSTIASLRIGSNIFGTFGWHKSIEVEGLDSEEGEESDYGSL